MQRQMSCFPCIHGRAMSNDTPSEVNIPPVPGWNHSRSFEAWMRATFAESSLQKLLRLVAEAGDPAHAMLDKPDLSFA